MENRIPGNQLHRTGTVDRLKSVTSDREISICTVDKTLYFKLGGELYPAVPYREAISVAKSEIIDSLGSALQWKGVADVAELNAYASEYSDDNIGYTYTVLDSGEILGYDGNQLLVQKDDEVSWTSSGWFKIGGESGSVLVLIGTSQSPPDGSRIADTVNLGKSVIVIWGDDSSVYYLSHIDGDTYKFKTLYNLNSVLQYNGSWSISIDNDVSSSESLAPEYNNQSNYVRGDVVTYQGSLYKCNVDSVAKQEFDASKWDKTSMSDLVPPTPQPNSVLGSDSSGNMTWIEPQGFNVDDTSLTLTETESGITLGSKLKPSAITAEYNTSYSDGFAVGSYTIYDGLLYKCITEIPSGSPVGAWDSSKWEAVSIIDIIGNLEMLLSSI